MVYSASAVWASYKFDDSFYFAKDSFCLPESGYRNVFHYAGRLLDVADLVKDTDCSVFSPPRACLDSWYRYGEMVQAGLVSVRLVFSPLNL